MCDGTEEGRGKPSQGWNDGIVVVSRESFADDRCVGTKFSPHPPKVPTPCGIETFPEPEVVPLV